MTGKYGFSDSPINLPKPKPKEQTKEQNTDLSAAVSAGRVMGFVSREPSTSLKPGPKRKEPQDRVTIPGPKRVVDQFRSFCQANELTLWEGLERLLKNEKS